MRSISLALVASEIEPGDVLLHRRGRSILSRAIAAVGRSPYSHAGMVDRIDDVLIEIDVTILAGATAGKLRPKVDRWPGLIDVYRPAASVERWQRQGAVRRMWRLTSQRYGWRAIFLAALVRVPVLRMLVRPAWAEERPGWLPFCSMAVSKSYRDVGVDLVPNLADRYTEPGDLARSALLIYQFTMEP
jgi:hypothetical protein